MPWAVGGLSSKSSTYHGPSQLTPKAKKQSVAAILLLLFSFEGLVFIGSNVLSLQNLRHNGVLFRFYSRIVLLVSSPVLGKLLFLLSFFYSYFIFVLLSLGICLWKFMTFIYKWKSHKRIFFQKPNNMMDLIRLPNKNALMISIIQNKLIIIKSILYFFNFTFLYQ